ncbi:hypothetical protein BHE74_00008655 [Ensete ventricosum]|nr:hypothetical protein BHE74_00008655 [Ensete ventricosum]RZR80207.1 hypothetical protein BHM03_00006156 [Ensete ventricosum]
MSKPSATTLLGLSQKDNEPCSHFVSRFITKIRTVPDAHPSLIVQAFLMGLQPSKFFWSLIERPLTTIKENGLLKAPNPMKTSLDLYDWAKYCRFHRDYGHDMEEFHGLKNQIKELIRKGYLGHYVKRPQEPSSCPHDLIEKQIDVIVGVLAFDGDCASGRKAYARTVMEKCPRKKDEPNITFEVGETKYPNHDDALVVSVRIANANFRGL